MLFCGQHIQKQIELGANDEQLCYRVWKTFRLTEFRVDLPFGGQPQERGSLTQEVACGRAHEMICNSVSAELDVARRPKAIVETALVAKLRTLNALTDLTFIVDSGASRDALPTQMMEGARWTPATSLSTSNGEALINRYERDGMPRVRPGKASPETREVLAINGPPVLSMGRMVESDKRRVPPPHTEW